ncbi:hypothetical protein KR51_00010660 [Rubidibacter lacunae KORDI 51-2]|uniref:Uncharacterized protein n=1 Tax=Rubidibacter lacunae KORDI 51-2 TaxID=582515 RepID=U5DKP3_9CHRO|nr:hypothetical protein KR51_00010660 [Rubidibacter lacunae KORDI 51-2]
MFLVEQNGNRSYNAVGLALPHWYDCADVEFLEMASWKKTALRARLLVSLPSIDIRNWS